MKEYTYSDLMRMQEQAIERAREMQRRAQHTARQANIDMGFEEEPKKEVEVEEEIRDTDNKNETIDQNTKFIKTENISFKGNKTQPHRRPISEKRLVSLPVDYLHTEDSNKIQASRNTIDFGIEKEQGHKQRPEESSEKSENPLFSMFRNLNIDSEQLLIMALFLLLKSEGADEGLLLALLYIMF